MNRVGVRPARPEDVPTLAQLVRDLAAYERAPEMARASDADLHNALFGAAPACRALVGEVDGEAQGMAIYFFNFSTWTGRRGVYLEDLFVRPAARGLGLGAALLRRVAGEAIDEGCQRVDWMVIDWNEPAIGFYRSLGARALSDWTVFRLDGEALRRVAGR